MTISYKLKTSRFIRPIFQIIYKSEQRDFTLIKMSCIYQDVWMILGIKENSCKRNWNFLFNELSCSYLEFSFIKSYILFSNQRVMYVLEETTPMFMQFHITGDNSPSSPCPLGKPGNLSRVTECTLSQRIYLWDRGINLQLNNLILYSSIFCWIRHIVLFRSSKKITTFLWLD